MGDGAAGLLQLITSAVTPVVMLSAAAALILGVNQKHSSLSDRLRTLAADFRRAETSPERRLVIQAQVRLLDRRFRWTSLAHVWLHGSVAAFGLMVLVLTITPRTRFWNHVALGLFVLGDGLVLIAVLAEILELRLARETLEMEVVDVFAASPCTGTAMPTPVQGDGTAGDGSPSCAERERTGV